MRGVNQSINQTQMELRGLTSLLKLDPKNTDLITQKQKLLASAVIDTRDKLDALRATQRKINDGSIEATEAEYRDLEREIASTEAKLSALTAEQRQFSSVSAIQLQAVGREFQQIGQRMSDAGRALLPMTIAIGAAAAASMKASIEFESSFAGVRKTVNATAEEFDRLAESSRQAALEKPVDVNEINHIKELGGQLGIATDALDGFADTVGDISVASDLDIETASTEIAQFANITSMSQGDIDRFGATLIALGNNSAATESAIMEFAMRISGAATQVNMSQSEILGLSASMASVGLSAESAGSSISTIMSNIDKAVAMNSDELSVWADTANMSVTEFSNLWENDAASAMEALVKGMGDSKAGGENLNIVLDELGITNIRQTDTMKRLSNASDIMSSSIDLAGQAWQENTALTNEASQRYATTESQLKMLQNQVVDIGISIGNGLSSALSGSMGVLKAFLSMVSGAAKAFENANPAAQGLITTSMGLTAALGPTLLVGGKIVTLFGHVTEAFGKSAAVIIAKTAATTADTAATTANITASNLQIAKNTIKEVIEAKAAARTTEKAAATTIDTAATLTNTAATTEGAAVSLLATVRSVALSAATKARTVATVAATVAQIALNAAMSANPIAVVVLAAAALTAVLAGLAVAIGSVVGNQENLSVASTEQKQKVDALRASYDEAVATQGEHSDAAIAAKAALDEESASFDESKETMGQFLERCNQAISTHGELVDSINDATSKADGEAGKLLYLSQQIEELSGKEGKSAEDKANLSAMTEALNTSCEGLNLTYDEQADKLNLTADAIQTAAKAEADRIRAQSAMESYSDLLSEQATLELQLADAQANLDKETNKNVDSWGKLGDVQVWESQTQVDLEKAVSDTKAALAENNSKQQEALKIAAQYTTKQSALSAAVEEVKNKTLTAEEAAEKYGVAVEGGITADEIRAQQDYETAMAEQKKATATNETVESMNAYTQSHPAFQTALANSGMTVESFSDLLVSQGVSFDDASAKIEEYASKVASGFSQIADSSENTLDKLYETLAFNLEATQNWGSNLEAVFGRTGVSFSQEFVNAVRAGGVEEYGTVMAQLAQLSDEELQSISDSYARNGQAGVEAYLSEQKLLVPGTKQALDETAGAVQESLSAGEQVAGQSGTDTGAAYSDNLSASIASSPQEVQVYISQLQQQLQAFQNQAGQSGMQTGNAYGANTAAGMASQTPNAILSAATLKDSVQAQMSGMPLYARNTGAATGGNMANGLYGTVGNVSAASYSLKGSAEGPLGSINGASYGLSAGNGFGSGIGSTWGSVNGNAASLSSCCNQWSNYGSYAWGWGNDAGIGFGSGIRSAIGFAIGAASDLAGAVRSILHFSVPDTGPLADADEYGPDFVKLFSDGIRSNIYLAKEAAQETASVIRENLFPDETSIGPYSLEYAISNGANALQRARLTAGISGQTSAAQTPVDMTEMLTELRAINDAISNQQIVMDTGVVAGSLTSKIDRNLGALQRRRSKGI